MLPPAAVAMYVGVRRERRKLRGKRLKDTKNTAQQRCFLCVWYDHTVYLRVLPPPPREDDPPPDERIDPPDE
jgi:hypothetical protein